jgi:CRISPR system Cascade subunit CasB
MSVPTGVESVHTSATTAATLRRGSQGERALEWWRRHCDPTNKKSDPAMRARLRRARSHLDVLRITPAVILARQLGAAPASGPAPEWKLYAALDLARVLAYVKQHDSRHPMRAAGWASFPGDRKESDISSEQRPRLSEARFRRLLETGGGEEMVASFTRLVVLLDGKVDVAQLASDFLMWNHPEYGDRVRERWAFNYLAADQAAPPLQPTDTEDAGE